MLPIVIYNEDEAERINKIRKLIQSGDIYSEPAVPCRYKFIIGKTMNLQKEVIAGAHYGVSNVPLIFTDSTESFEGFEDLSTKTFRVEREGKIVCQVHEGKIVELKEGNHLS